MAGLCRIVAGALPSAMVLRYLAIWLVTVQLSLPRPAWKQPETANLIIQTDRRAVSGRDQPWLAIGAIAGGQRHYYSSSDRTARKQARSP
jgi:hypothetical protein